MEMSVNIINEDSPAQSWVGLLVLQRDYTPEILHARVESSVIVWSNMRHNRKELELSDINGVQLPDAPRVYRMCGTIQASVKEAIPTVQEFLTTLGMVLRAKHIELHVGGNKLFQTLLVPEKPEGYKLN